MSTVATETIAIDMFGDCTSPGCKRLATDMLAKLDIEKYRSGVALLAVPGSLEEWRAEHRTARKRADRASRRGYRFAEIDRSQYGDDIYEINTSLPMRQGRPMSDGYRHHFTPGKLPVYPCRMHNIRTWGILQGERLRAYLGAYRLNELCLISMILGHGAHLGDEIMYLLFHGVIEDQAGLGGWFYYNRFDSGTDGLRFWKERQGFREAEVAWVT